MVREVFVVLACAWASLSNAQTLPRSWPRHPSHDELAALREEPESLAREAARLLGAGDVDAIERGLDIVGWLPLARLDDPTLRGLVGVVAEAAVHDVAGPFVDCGTGMELWPRAAHHRVSAALLRLGAQVPEALLETTRHARPEARMRAMDALDALPSRTTQARFEELLGDPDPRVRVRAADALDRMRPCGHGDTLTPLLMDADASVRRHVAVLLATCGRRDALAVLADGCDGTWAREPPPPPQESSLDLPGEEECVQLARLVTHDLPGALWEKRTAERLERRRDVLALGVDGTAGVDPGPGHPWRAWWSAHGTDVDPLERNVDLAAAGPARGGTHRVLSLDLLERACDEPCLRRLTAVAASSPVASITEKVRDRLAPGALAAIARDEGQAVGTRARALRRLFGVDRLRARDLQLALFDAEERAAREVALHVARSFPLPPRRVRATLLAWVERGERLPRGWEVDFPRDCELARSTPRLATAWGCGGTVPQRAD